MTGERTPVDRLFEEFNGVLATLSGPDQISSNLVAQDQFRKAILLAAASHFENVLSNIVLAFVESETIGTNMISTMVRTKVVKRQYHTWFDWDNLKATPFFSMFGDEFKNFMNTNSSERPELKEGISHFLQIGSERNKLVHRDFATFQLEKTLEEIYAAYCKARVFIDFLPEALRSHAAQARGAVA